MKKSVFGSVLVLSVFSFLNAYTLVLNDNSFVRGELEYIAPDYTLMKVDGKKKKIPNTKIKKRFFTKAEKAARGIVDNKMSTKKSPLIEDVVILDHDPTIEYEVVQAAAGANQGAAAESSPGDSLEFVYDVDIEEAAGSSKPMRRDVRQPRSTIVHQPQDSPAPPVNQPVGPDTLRINVFGVVDFADDINGKTRMLPDGGFGKSLDSQTTGFGFGLDVEERVFGLTRVSAGSIFYLQRDASLGKIENAVFYGRIMHPFDPKHTENYLGIEVNMSSPSFPEFFGSQPEASSKVGFGVFERRYFNQLMIEAGIRITNMAVAYTYQGFPFESEFMSIGSYIVGGYSF